jgi:putative membrane protein
VVLASPLAGQTMDPDTSKPAASTDRVADRQTGPVLSRADQRFVKKAVACSDYELALSRQASTQASNAQVRAFAAGVVRDHERMNRELTTFAARRGVMLPPSQRHQEDLADLGKQTGDDYDDAYLDDMIDSHEDAIDLLEDASKSGDTDIAAFAVQHLPAMRDHLARARQLEKLVD